MVRAYQHGDGTDYYYYSGCFLLEKALCLVIGNEEMKRKAEEVEKHLREEHGVEQAVQAITMLEESITSKIN